MEISRILVYGSDKIFAIENYYVKYLKEMGITVAHFSARSIFYDHYQRNFINRLFFHLGFPIVYKTINKQFKEMVNSFHPDVIWVFKGMELFPDSLEWARGNNVKLVNYNSDNPFHFSGVGSGNKNLTKSLPLYHLHFTYSASVKSKLERALQLKTVLLPFGFDVDKRLFLECATQQEICETCFLGNPDQERANFIGKLADFGIHISLYGNNWKKFIKHPNVIVNGPIYGEESSKVFRKYRVQLNLLRAHNELSHNMRTFEVPAVGGIMLAPETSDHRMFFKDGAEIFLFRDINDCVEKIRMILTMPKEQADKIRIAARRRVVQSGYSYRHRTEQVVDELRLL